MRSPSFHGLLVGLTCASSLCLRDPAARALTERPGVGSSRDSNSESDRSTIPQLLSRSTGIRRRITAAPESNHPPTHVRSAALFRSFLPERCWIPPEVVACVSFASLSPITVVRQNVLTAVPSSGHCSGSVPAVQHLNPLPLACTLQTQTSSERLEQQPN